MFQRRHSKLRKYNGRLIELALAKSVFAILLMFVNFSIAQELFEEEPDSIPPEVERMYRRGLDFLTRTQTPKGYWQDTYGQQPAVVGLAILAMLAHGDDPNTGPYAIPIKRGLDFILENQNKVTGYIGNSMYNHGFATLALAEAYGAVNDERLGPALKKAVDLILVSQTKNPFGAWRYSPESTDADTTVSGAQMVALFAAKNAGIDIPEEAIKKG
ncbi:MAG: squalene--hopene cyclase, partial [Limisphaerales bacterium]